MMKMEEHASIHSYFHELKPLIKEVLITKHFQKTAPDFDIQKVVDSRHEFFTHLHKFEETIEGNHIFRALEKKTHLVYVVDTNHRLIFLSGFSNFKEYKKFLEDKKRILDMIREAWLES